MFLDTVNIRIKAGDGGDGKTSFYRSKLTMNGGPDGGDGGKGGDIIFAAKEDLNTLYNFKFKKKFVAENGNGGDQNFRSGKSGADTIIEVPVGTVIKNKLTGAVLADLSVNGQQVKILTGGNGGKGNTFYKSPTRQAPSFSQLGEKVKEFDVSLELKTIADVGIVGYPSVGKSTLLSVVSNARPKIADYHFTTLVPNLGVVADYGEPFVMADIPGLIEGASEGAGLGHEFLRHIERVRLILHLVDISGLEGRDPYDDYVSINNELKKYSEKLAALPQIVALTKIDMLNDEKKIDDFKKKVGKNVIVVPICSIIHTGLKELMNEVQKKLSVLPKSEPIEVTQVTLDERDKTSLWVKSLEDGSYEVGGGLIDNMIRGIVLSDATSLAYFQKRLEKDGILDKLKEAGAKQGDTVHIKDAVFEMVE